MHLYLLYNFITFYFITWASRVAWCLRHGVPIEEWANEFIYAAD